MFVPLGREVSQQVAKLLALVTLLGLDAKGLRLFSRKLPPPEGGGGFLQEA